MLDEVEQQIRGRARLQESQSLEKQSVQSWSPGRKRGERRGSQSESGVHKQPDRSSKTKIKSQPRLAKNRALLTLKLGDPGRLWRRCSVYSCRKSFVGGRKSRLMSVCFMAVVSFLFFFLFLRVSSSLCFLKERQAQAVSLTEVGCQSTFCPFFLTSPAKQFSEHERAVL